MLHREENIKFLGRKNLTQLRPPTLTSNGFKVMACGSSPNKKLVGKKNSRMIPSNSYQSKWNRDVKSKPSNPFFGSPCAITDIPL